MVVWAFRLVRFMDSGKEAAIEQPTEKEEV